MLFLIFMHSCSLNYRIVSIAPNAAIATVVTEAYIDVVAILEELSLVVPSRGNITSMAIVQSNDREYNDTNSKDVLRSDTAWNPAPPSRNLFVIRDTVSVPARRS